MIGSALGMNVSVCVIGSVCESVCDRQCIGDECECVCDRQCM